MTLLSLFQTFGAIVGIITGCVVLGDRWMKQRPYAVLFGDSPERFGRRRFWVKVINPSGYPIIVTAKPNRDSFYVGKDEEIRSAITAAMGATSTFCIEGFQERTFVAYEPHRFDELPADSRFSTALSWKRAQSGPWSMARGSMRISILKGDAQILLGDRDRFDDEAE